MDDSVAQKVVKQVKQIPGEVWEGIKKTPGEIVASSFKPAVSAKVQPTVESDQTKLAQVKAKDEAQTKAEIKKLEAEMARFRQEREAQLRQRRQPPPTPATSQEKILSQPTARPKRGLFGGLRRVKTAQEKAGAETVVRRVSG